MYGIKQTRLIVHSWNQSMVILQNLPSIVGTSFALVCPQLAPLTPLAGPAQPASPRAGTPAQDFGVSALVLGLLIRLTLSTSSDLGH